MAKRISADEKKEIISDFVNRKNLEELSEKFNFTKVTISRHLKRSLGEDKFSELNKLTKKDNKYRNHNYLDNENTLNENFEIGSEKFMSQDSFNENAFLEIAPLNLEIDNKPQVDLTSVSLTEVNLPKVVYMIVDKQIELNTKLLKEYVEWNFLSEKDLNRNTIEIFYDMKTAKRSTKKDQRVIKIPNSDVFKITAPILLSRGITRIVSSELLIAL